jgi:type I restriction enzyme R subunit
VPPDAGGRTTEEGLKAVEAELATLRAEYAALRKANAAVPDDHDYSEAETRDSFIDQLLTEAGWALDQTRDREFPVTGRRLGRRRSCIDPKGQSFFVEIFADRIRLSQALYAALASQP